MDIINHWMFPMIFFPSFFFLMFILIFGDANVDSYLGWATGLLTRSLPKFIGRCVRSLPFGGYITEKAYRAFHYVVYERNPIMQGVYVIMIVGSYGLFAMDGLQFIPNPYLPWYHRHLSFGLVCVVMICFTIACVSDPGVVDSQEKARHYEKSFPYDGFLFVHRECATCKTIKTPRSKHCAICNQCIAKFDHHCPWINCCVGEKNHRWFLLFLAATASYLVYASWGLFNILLHICDRANVWNAKFVSPTDPSDVVGPSMLLIFQYLLVHFPIIMGLQILSFVMAIALTVFFVHHLYLVEAGTTTNESDKWNSIGSYYKDLVKARAKGKYIPTQSLEELLDPAKNKPIDLREPASYPIEQPKNIYDYGMAENVRLVLFPRCLSSVVDRESDREAVTEGRTGLISKKDD